MGAPPVPEMTPAVLIRDSRGADSQYLAVLMRANTQIEGAGFVVKRSKLYQNRDEESCRIYLELDEDKVMGWMLANLEKASLDDPS